MLFRSYGGSSRDEAWGVVLNPKGGLYTLGLSDGQVGTVGDTSPTGTAKDTTITKIAGNGDVIWVNEFGTPGLDLPENGAIGPDGRLYVAGITNGALSGHTFLGGLYDAFVYGINSDGSNAALRQFGTAGAEGNYTYAVGLALRPNGTLVLATNSDKSPWGAGTPAGSDI